MNILNFSKAGKYMPMILKFYAIELKTHKYLIGQPQLPSHIQDVIFCDDFNSGLEYFVKTRSQDCSFPVLIIDCKN